jgi:hypothetical protein
MGIIAIANYQEESGKMNLKVIIRQNGCNCVLDGKGTHAP